MTSLPVLSASVLTGSGPDKISLRLATNPSFRDMGYAPFATMEAQPGYGADWVRETLHIEPSVIKLTGH